MHLAFICPDFTGHLNPMLTLARALIRRGHRITLISLPESRRHAERAGVPFIPVGEAEQNDTTLPRMHTRLAELRGLEALIQTGKLFEFTADLYLRDLPGILARGGFDAALLDQLTVANVVCEALGMPYGVVCNALAMHMEPAVPPPVADWPPWNGWVGRLRNRLAIWLTNLFVGSVATRLNRFCRDHHLPPWTVEASFQAGLIQVAQQPAFFDFPREQLPEHFHYTGPWHEAGRDTIAFPWDRLDGRPLVYASLGTVQTRLGDLYTAIARAVHGLDVQLVLSLGRQDPVSVEGPLPPGAILVPYAPQLEILQKATAVITHAGLNTSLETLAAGLPMVALPLTNDQPGNARRLAWLGVAELVPFWHARPTRLHEELQKILRRPRYREAARRYQDKLRRGPTVDDAARLVEHALGRKELLTRSQAAALQVTGGNG